MKTLHAVRESAEVVAKRARFLHVVERGISELADRIVAGAFVAPREEPRLARDGDRMETHYLLVLNTLNFCFWPEPAWSFERLSLALEETLRRAPERYRASSLAGIEEADVRDMLGGSEEIPLLAQRTRLLRELGVVLEARWEGEAANLVRAANHSAAALVQLVAAELPGFRDQAIYRGWPVYLYRCALAFVATLWRSFEGKGPGRFDDIQELTAFAGSRLPQVLRAEGVLEYRARLSSVIDLCRELPGGSELEVEIRAAAIYAVELLRDALRSRGREISAVELGAFLRYAGAGGKRALKPHHRTLTIYY